jgi:hypothetical protein
LNLRPSGYEPDGNPQKPGNEAVWCYGGAMTNLLFILVLWDP